MEGRILARTMPSGCGWGASNLVGQMNMPTTPTTPIAATDAEIAAIAWNADGLVPAIAQDRDTGQVLMLAWMNEDAVRATFAEGRMVYWSRSRQELWRKGDTSGDRQWVREAYYDCDGDALLFVVEQEGRGACHTGERSCFFRGFGTSAAPGRA